MPGPHRFAAWRAMREYGMTLAFPIPLARWIDEHRHLLKPPVGNKCIVDGDFIVMIVGGPNARDDWHVEEGPEFFLQIEGRMVLRIQQDGKPVEVPIHAGELYYLPPGVPHSPQREAGSVGLVIERRRRPGERDGLIWYCERCNHLLYAEHFELVDIETQFPPVFERYHRDPLKRRCAACGHVNPAGAAADR
jgi:3-hydroxyanthranilate 3,4-dioxygenase